MKKNSPLGKTANITIDRKQGSRNIRHKNITYTVNIGYLAAEKDYGRRRHIVYILGAENTSNTFEGTILCTIKRKKDSSVLLVASPLGKCFYEPQIRECLRFFERQHESDYEFYMEKVCGAVLLCHDIKEPRFLLVENALTGHIGFPKGHIEFGETEQETAVREIYEETGIAAQISDGFRTEYQYSSSEDKKKRAVYFLASCSSSAVKLQQTEISDSWLLTYDEAMKKLNYPQDMIVLMEAHDFYEQERKSEICL
ncbi:MAG: NUDIX domain-containing protein [Oscillospiraceae bacterium]|nr:NUDIX domain-containing protein [Oscillospiraceae bacterium]